MEVVGLEQALGLKVHQGLVLLHVLAFSHHNPLLALAFPPCQQRSGSPQEVAVQVEEQKSGSPQEVCLQVEEQMEVQGLEQALELIQVQEQALVQGLGQVLGLLLEQVQEWGLVLQQG